MTRDKATVDDVRRTVIAEGIVEPSDWGALTPQQVQWHIDSYATLLIDEEIDNTTHDMSEARLKAIEAMLAGHAILSSGIEEVRQLRSEMLSDNSQSSYAAEIGTGLYGTTLGQKAMELDKTGRLRAIADTDTSGDFWAVTLTE